MSAEKLEILYEDNHLLILNKPAGLLTQPSGTQQPSLEEYAKRWIKVRDHKPGNVFLEAVHRLDKPVSGIVVFAKSSKALSRLNASMRSGQCIKEYLALVEGVLKTTAGTLEHYLRHEDYRTEILEKEHGGKLARLHYHLVETRENQTLLNVTLETGRYHQIRAQLAAQGHPIVGDAKYGSRTSLNREGIALHHCQLTLPHPITGEPLEIRSQVTF